MINLLLAISAAFSMMFGAKISEPVDPPLAAQVHTQMQAGEAPAANELMLNIQTQAQTRLQQSDQNQVQAQDPSQCLQTTDCDSEPDQLREQTQDQVHDQVQDQLHLHDGTCTTCSGSQPKGNGKP